MPDIKSYSRIKESSERVLNKSKTSSLKETSSDTPDSISSDTPLGLVYKKKIVSFIDILGFRNIVMKSSEHIEHTGAVSPEAMESDLASRIHGALNIPFNSYIHSFRKMQGLPDDSELDISISTFSDSVIVFAPCNPKSFALMIHVISHIVRDMVKNGFLTRGGIAYGEVYHGVNRLNTDQSLTIEPVFGPAFIKAYDLESKQAKFARIILCNATWKLAQDWLSEGECVYCSYIQERITRDKDGPARIHTLRHLEELSKDMVEPEVREIKRQLETVLSYYVESPTVFSKLAIFANEFNAIVKRFEDESLLISADYLPS